MMGILTLTWCNLTPQEKCENSRNVTMVINVFECHMGENMFSRNKNGMGILTLTWCNLTPQDFFENSRNVTMVLV